MGLLVSMAVATARMSIINTATPAHFPLNLNAIFSFQIDSKQALMLGSLPLNERFIVQSQSSVPSGSRTDSWLIAEPTPNGHSMYSCKAPCSAKDTDAIFLGSLTYGSPYSLPKR